MVSPESTLAGYKVLGLLGSGGMGSVYLAEHPSLPRYDALKVLSAELSRDENFRARFLREAEVAAKLDHPNIVAVYDRGQTDDGKLWIAMQYVDGTDAEAASASPMPPERAVHIVTEVAKGLDHAHARNIIHRDVKPANFLLSGKPGVDERVLLGDFGIARALDDVGMTATGSFLATVPYSAPEVLSGNPIDGRADIYSLGCTLYRLLTGMTPFPATNGMAAVMMAHLQQAPPRVTDLAPWLPPSLDEVVAIGMAKDPAARFQTASALAEAAATALRNPNARIAAATAPVPPRWNGPSAHMQPAPLTSARHTSVSPRPAPARRRRPVLIGAAVVVIGLVVGATAILWPSDGSAPANAPTASSPNSNANTPPTAQGRPATDVTPQALRPILLSAEQIAAATGGGQLILDVDLNTILNDGAEVGAPECVSAWAPAQDAVYGGTGFDASHYTGMAVQELRALNAAVWQDGVIQAVVSLPSTMEVSGFMQGQVREWGVCAAKGPVNVTPPNGPQTPWTFTAPVTTSGLITLTATPATGGGSCQRGLLARGNVVIDIRQCRPEGNVDVAALVRATGERVPRA